MPLRISLVSTPIGLSSSTRLYLDEVASELPNPHHCEDEQDLKLFWELTRRECTSLGYSDISRIMFSLDLPRRAYIPWEGLYILLREVRQACPEALISVTDVDLLLAQSAAKGDSADSGLVADHALACDPEIVAVSFNYSMAKRDFRALCAQLRARSPSITIVAGGRHATACPQDAFECGANHVFLGEADGAFGAVLKSMAGSGYPTNHNWLLASTSGRADIHIAKPYELQVPDYSRLSGQDLEPLTPVLYASVARGCTNNCAFCSHSAFYKGRCTHYPVRLALDTLANVTRSFPFARRRLFIMQHVSFGIDPEWTKSLCEALSGRTIPPWVTDMRPDTVVELGTEGLARMASAGCVGVFLGVESLSDEALAVVRKKYNTHNIRQALRLLRQTPLFIATYWVVGLPGEDSDSCLRNVITPCLELLDTGQIDLAQPHLLTALPGTDIALRASEYGITQLFTDAPSFLAHSADVQLEFGNLGRYRLLGLYVYFLAELNARIPRQIQSLRQRLGVGGP